MVVEKFTKFDTVKQKNVMANAEVFYIRGFMKIVLSVYLFN